MSDALLPFVWLTHPIIAFNERVVVSSLSLRFSAMHNPFHVSINIQNGQLELSIRRGGGNNMDFNANEFGHFYQYVWVYTNTWSAHILFSAHLPTIAYQLYPIRYKWIKINENYADILGNVIKWMSHGRGWMRLMHNMPNVCFITYYYFFFGLLSPSR